MKPINHHQRCAAAQEFQQSLTQLEDILQVNSTENQVISEIETSNASHKPNSKNTENIDLAALEDAVADIEQYLAQKDKKQKS
ncbi:hypothetical protein H6G06_13520 [Anabaena sphaerica FACHB-251]|uniref:Uncharacterized protein n=1 Tax=Anabaena sphaerica FACHB-251 TaxID=2692883 RepID=A0A926WHX4_9NOST|nr:hypothetical protein [Anabaena sphaerica]MBD2294467.1 hypothetical protein [Anabaena sphaerica FACHB-251]